MSILRDMLKHTLREDFDNYVRPTASCIKEVSLGLLEGLYTPLLINTGSRRIDKAWQSDRDLKAWTHTAFATIVGVGFIGSGLLYNLHLKGEFWKEYLGVLGIAAVTNTVDYFVNVYKRAKHLDDLYQRQKPGWHL